MKLSLDQLKAENYTTKISDVEFEEVKAGGEGAEVAQGSLGSTVLNLGLNVGLGESAPALNLTTPKPNPLSITLDVVNQLIR